MACAGYAPQKHRAAVVHVGQQFRSLDGGIFTDGPVTLQSTFRSVRFQFVAECGKTYLHFLIVPRDKYRLNSS